MKEGEGTQSEHFIALGAQSEHFIALGTAMTLLSVNKHKINTLLQWEGVMERSIRRKTLCMSMYFLAK